MLALIYQELNKYNKAIKYHKKTLFIDNQSAQYYVNYSLTLFYNNKFKKSLFYAKQALIYSCDIRVYLNLATLYQMLKKSKKSKKYYTIALKIDHNNADALFGLSLVYLQCNDILNGFKYYESRWNYSSFTTKKRDYLQPKWNGNIIKNKKLFIHYEQGYGDNIMFVRFINQVKKISQAYIILEISKPLYKLFSKYTNGWDKLILLNKNFIDFDYYLPIMSIPNALNLRKKNIIKDKYLNIKNDHKNNNKEFRIGISWKGSKTHILDNRRSIDLNILEPLFDLKNTIFYSLEIDTNTQQELKEYPKIINLGKKINNFYDTAKYIQELDLVICVDTSVAHLSGALGKPTFILLSKISDWRWGKKDNNIWYNSISLYRQKKIDIWRTPIKNIKNDIIILVNKTSKEKRIPN